MIKRFPNLIWIIAGFLVVILGVPLVGTKVLNNLFGMDVAGWVQAGVALVGFPVLMYQLSQIRESLGRKPNLEIGVANIQDLPFSRVRENKKLPNRVNINVGYTHFYIILRNSGYVPARYVKVYVEHVNRNQKAFPPPLVKVSEFSQNKPSFVHEHNFDFVFRAGTDWIINPADIEPFGFHVTTAIFERVVDASGNERTEPKNPPLCEVILDCTAWAEGLESPHKVRLFVNIVPTLEKTSDGNQQP